MSWARPACVSHLPSRGGRVSPRRRGGPRQGGQSCHCLRPSPDASLQNDKSVPGRITQPLRPMWLESGSSRVPRGRAPSPARAASWGAGGSHLSTGLLRCLRGLPLRVPCTPRQVCALARSHRYLSPNLKHRQFKGQRTATTGAAFAGEPSPPPTSGLARLASPGRRPAGPHSGKPPEARLPGRTRRRRACAGRHRLLNFGLGAAVWLFRDDA